MSLPNFIQSKLGESGSTTLIQVVRVINGIISQLQTIFTYLKGKVQLDSILIQSISLQTGSNQVHHTLGRTLTGWTLTRIRSQSIIWDDQDNQPNPKQYLTLMASAPAVVDILVF